MIASKEILVFTSCARFKYHDIKEFKIVYLIIWGKLVIIIKQELYTIIEQRSMTSLILLFPLFFNMLWALNQF